MLSGDYFGSDLLRGLANTDVDRDNTFSIAEIQQQQFSPIFYFQLQNRTKQEANWATDI